MRLTVYTDYALRLLMYLRQNDGLATIAEVADSYGISKNHLMKVAHQLGVAGYVDTVRGPAAGCGWPNRSKRSISVTSCDTLSPTWRSCPALLLTVRLARSFQAARCAARFRGRATRSFRRSTGTPWRILSVRAHHSGDCWRSSQMAERCDNGMPSERSHIAGAGSDTRKTEPQQHRDRIGAASSYVA